MKNRAVKIAYLVFAAACVLSLAGWKVLERGARQGQEEMGVVAPVKADGPNLGFDLEDWDGGRARIADYDGRWVLVNYWATWCTSCAEELPSMAALNRLFTPKGLEVVGISVDEEWGVVKAFFPGRRPPFRILLDSKGKLAAQYGTVKFPETYLYGPDGKLRYKFIGPRDWADPRVVSWFQKIIGGR